MHQGTQKLQHGIRIRIRYCGSLGTMQQLPMVHLFWTEWYITGNVWRTVMEDRCLSFQEISDLLADIANANFIGSWRLEDWNSMSSPDGMSLIRGISTCLPWCDPSAIMSPSILFWCILATRSLPYFVIVSEAHSHTSKFQGEFLRWSPPNVHIFRFVKGFLIDEFILI